MGMRADAYIKDLSQPPSPWSFSFSLPSHLPSNNYHPANDISIQPLRNSPFSSKNQPSTCLPAPATAAPATALLALAPAALTKSLPSIEVDGAILLGRMLICLVPF